MDTAIFDPAGGPLVAVVTSGFAQPGSYILRLYEANRNQLVTWPNGRTEQVGNFLNADDDRYNLPEPVADNDRRLVECFVAVEVTPPLNDYDLGLEIWQDGARLARDSKSGSGAPHQTIVANLFVGLVQR